MSTAFPNWQNIVKEHDFPKKKVLLLVSLYNPVYPALSLEETHEKFPHIDIVLDLNDVIKKFNSERIDGAFIELLDTDWDNSFYLVGLSCNETADPVKLFSRNISMPLSNKWKELVKTENRLFSVRVLDYHE